MASLNSAFGAASKSFMTAASAGAEVPLHHFYNGATAVSVPNGPCRGLRIAVVTETYPPEVNGVARTIGTMVERLLARGHRIQLVRPRQGKQDKPRDTAHLETLLRPGVPIPYYRELRMGLPAKRVLEQNWRLRRPDVVQVVTEGPLGSSALAAAKTLGIPACSEFHTNFDRYSSHYGAGLLADLIATYLRHLHNRAELTMVPTQELAEQLSAEGYRRLRVVGRGIDTALFGPGQRSEALRRSWSARPQDTVAIYVGRLAPEKNLRLFVRAARAMRAIDPRLRVVVVGDGPDAAALRASEREFVFAGMRTGAELARHYASADVLLFPSLTETFGNVTTEALASRLAVVAYDYAAARQYIRHGESGLLAPFGQSDRFVALASQIAADRSLLERIRAGAELAAHALSWDRVIDDLEAVLLELRAQDRGAQAQPAASCLLGPDHAPL